jgi:cytochrome c-type biogenesis protein CcmH
MTPSKRVSAFVLLAAIAVAVAGLVVVAVRAGSGGPTSLQDRTRAVARTLRCPVCQNLSVADSPSGIAQEMRRTIAADLRAGKTPGQIRDEFVQAYGEWILLAPPKRGLDLVAWLVPALLVVGAVGAAWLAIRRWTGSGQPASATPAALSDEDRALLDRALSTAEDDVP